ncbi:MAG: tetratricopeptide repeat protein, partial [Candidatus Anstonellales archaeon]
MSKKIILISKELEFMAKFKRNFSYFFKKSTLLSIKNSYNKIIKGNCKLYRNSNKNEYKKGAEMNENYVRKLLKLGNQLLEQDRYMDAVEKFREALTIDNNCAEAHNNLAVALSNLGIYWEAKFEYLQAIKLEPKNFLFHSNFGLLLVDLGFYKEAEKEFRKSIRLNPKFVEAHKNLGLTLLRLGKNDEA